MIQVHDKIKYIRYFKIYTTYCNINLYNFQYNYTV